jgi:hypothetical protein
MANLSTASGRACPGHTSITAAGAATEATEAAIGNACRALAADRWVNGFGLYRDRSTVIANLTAAKDALAAAIVTLRSCTWPTDADYGEA